MQPTPPPWRVIESVPADPSRAGSADPDQQAAAGRPSPAVVLALALAGILLASAFAVAALPGEGSVEVRVTSTARGAAAGSANPNGTIVVDVAGAVVRPGVHTLSRGARVGEAIAAAGGYGPRVDADAAGRELNLAALLKDGERIRVPSRDDSAPATPAAGGLDGDAGARLLNLNTASTSELEALPGIGPATAAKILAARAQRRFARVDELLERKLVSSKVLEGVRGLVTAS